MKRVYIGNKELTTIATVTNGGGGGDDTQKWLDYFNGTLTEFTVPEGVTNVNPSTFVSCTGLTSLTLPSSVTSIGSDDRHGMGGETKPFGTLKTMTVKATTPPTFSNKWNIPIPTTISSIYVPKYSVNIYKSIDNWKKYADKIQALPQNETMVTYNDGTTKKFDIKGNLTQTSIVNKKDITKVIIGDDVTNIGYEAFSDCAGLTSITISDSVTKIGAFAFQACSNLKSLTIGTGITELGYEMLNASLSISSITILSPNKPTTDSWTFFGFQTSGKLYVPSNLLADYQADTNYTNAFKGGIYAVENSMKVTYTDGTEKTFTGLTSIEKNTDSNKKNAKNVVIYDNVLSINESAFQNCSGLTSVTIPYSVMYIGEQAFQSCQSLTGITIPNSVTSIGQFAFDSCTSLTNIEIPSSVTIINPSTIRDCSGLTSVTIPNGVTKIDNAAFKDSINLTSVTIPASVKYIIDFAFAGCTSLASVTIQNSTSKLKYNYEAFKGISSTAKLYVPSNLLADYQADSSWTGAFQGGIYAIQ